MDVDVDVDVDVMDGFVAGHLALAAADGAAGLASSDLAPYLRVGPR